MFGVYTAFVRQASREDGKLVETSVAFFQLLPEDIVESKRRSHTDRHRRDMTLLFI